MLDMPLTKMDKMVMNAGKELSLRIAEQLGIHYRLSSQYQFESSHLMTTEQFSKTYHLENFDYSLLFNTGGGYFAFCIKHSAFDFSPYNSPPLPPYSQTSPQLPAQ